MDPRLHEKMQWLAMLPLSKKVRGSTLVADWSLDVPSLHMGFLQVLWFPITKENHAGPCIS